MTPEENLLSLVGGDAEPQLDSDELAQCLIDGAVPDSSGLTYLDPHWTETYDFNRAASSGFTRKAAKVAADYTITIEGRELNRGQMIDNFLKMAAEYLKKSQPRYTTAAGLIEPWRV